MQEMQKYSLVVKATDQLDALIEANSRFPYDTDFVVKTTHFVANKTEVVVRAEGAKRDQQSIARILNEWVCEDIGRKVPFPTGALLYWHMWEEAGTFLDGSDTDKLFV